MRNGAEPTAVRVLPADGIQALKPQVPLEPRDHGRRWPVLLAGFGVALLFVAATRPATVSDAAPAPTTAPPGLAAVDAELIDLRPPTTTVAATDWEVAAFDETSTIADVMVFNSSIVAIGSDSEGAQAWLSSTGAAWRTVPRMELPDTAKSSVDHAVVWKGDIVALGSVDAGVGLWVAGTLSRWVYHGQVETMDANVVTDLVAGKDLLAISNREGQLKGWKSQDGLAWEPIGEFKGLEGVTPRSFAALDGWYFVAGSEECDNQICRPVIYRSQDAVAWEPTDDTLPGVLSIDRGMVIDIDATTGGLIAVGWSGPSTAPGTEIAIWTSSDGADWTRIAEDESLLQPTRASITLVQLDLRADPIATVMIDGDRYQVVPDSEVATAVGTFRVEQVGPSGIRIARAGIVNTLEPDETLVVHRGVVPTGIRAEGPRIVVTGYFDSEVRTPAILSSADRGATWAVTEPEMAGIADAAALLRSRIVTTGTTPSGSPAVWAARWDTDATEAAGVDTLNSYIAAINDRDVTALSALLPRNADGTETPEFQVPSLGEVDLPWWQEDRAQLDVDAMGETLGHLDALHTDTSISECNTTMTLGPIDNLRIVCDVEVTSDLLAVMSPNTQDGRLVGILKDGSLSSVALSPAPSAAAWRALASGTAGATDEDRATLMSIDSRGRTNFDPTFTQASATVHLRLATEFVSSLLRPGDTKVVETLFGTMEWRWLETMPAPVYSFDWITRTETGFMAIGREHYDDVNPRLSLWSSLDGIDWVELPAPEGIQSMWQLHPYQGGFVVQGWRGSESVLLLFDGDEWTEITFPPPEDGAEGGPGRMAVSGDRILVFTQIWEHDGPGNRQAWLVGTDLTLRPATMPDEALTNSGDLGLVGSDEGFIVATSVGGSGGHISVWHSPDGESWTQIAESASIDDAQYIWNLQQHRDRYFVVGQGLETTCWTTLESGEICQQAVAMWTSPDGVAWDRLVTKSGVPLATYEIADGPLGLAAVGQENFEANLPRSLYFSEDGQTWEYSAGLSLLHPDATGWWVGNPAIGTDTIIITGSSYNERASGVDRDVPFLIIGRVIDDG